MANSDAVKHHDCGSENVLWDSAGYESAGMGETLERKGTCKKCKKRVKEVWAYSCELIDE